TKKTGSTATYDHEMFWHSANIEFLGVRVFTLSIILLVYLCANSMFFVRDISLLQFKNYTQRHFSFEKDIICLSGENGSGKTSVMDAIYFLCFTKSYFTHNDAYLVKHGSKGMRIQGVFEKQQPHEICCILRENGKKEFSMDGELYTQFSKHIGKFPVVMIAPDDTELITEGSELRRRFLDMIISQLNSDYLSHLIQYNKVLQQRNALLKQLAQPSGGDASLLDVYDQLLDQHGKAVYRFRMEVCQALAEKTNRIYTFLSQEKEDVSCVYKSALANDSLLDLLQQNRSRDMLMQRTLEGIHKDDLVFTMNSMPLKQVASQGQRKSFLFGLKFAQYELLAEGLGIKPVLLLDDIFEKLDEERSRRLVEFVGEQQGQVFITDTHHERIEKAFAPFADRLQHVQL
nr:DNA replication and repair protein RecF [Chitinophagaceae bacterium]